MRFHLLAPPNVQTTSEYSLDGFCSATIRMARMLKMLGHEVVLYASEENEAPCDELVSCVTKEEQETLLNGVPYQYAGMHQGCYPLWALANGRMRREIGLRKQPRDFLLTISGVSQKDVLDAHADLIGVEYSIGYVSTFARFRVYESHVWRAMNYGLQSNIDGHYFDDVIPLGFDPDEHPFREAADEPPFALFVGRIFVKKGIEVACKAARVAGLPLKVVGHGDPALVTDGAELVGTLSRDARNDIMSRAAVVCMPTTYFEPFGSVAVEAQMSGTPVVASHFGAFIETIEHGKTGFLCSYIGEFAAALNAARSLDRRAIRERAVARYGLQTVAQDYQRYFDRLSLLWERGFDTEEALPGWEQRRC